MYTHALRTTAIGIATWTSCALAQIQGPSTLAPPYLVPSLDGAVTVSLITAGETPSDSSNYALAGIPDGMGVIGTDDGKVRLLVNHELYPEMGMVRSHGARGAFISEWTVDPLTHAVESGRDAIDIVYTWNRDSLTYESGPETIRRLCSGDIPEVTAFYDEATGAGTTERFFTAGEEFGRLGRAFAHVLTGDEAGRAYELPYLGQTSFENVVACPYPQPWTIVAGLDDSQLGQVYFYLGRKQSEGSLIEKAGLANGRLWALSVNGVRYEDRKDIEGSVRFHLVRIGDASTMDGNQIERTGNRQGAMAFLRPEDGHWDPVTMRDFYFVTTDRFDQLKEGTGIRKARSRLYKLTFDDIGNPQLGGRMSRVVDGTEPGTQMFDNMCMNRWGHVLLQEDPGNAERPARIWRYDIPSDEIVELARNDSLLFGDLGRPPTPPFSYNDETSGIVDASELMGPGWYLANVQAHSPFPDSSIIEHGQLLALYDPAADRTSLEITPPVPGLADTLNAVTVTGAVPGQVISLHHGVTPGYTSIGACSALSVQILDAKIVADVEADSTGTATFIGAVPAELAGQSIWLQAASADSCVIGPPISVTFH